MRRVFYCGLFVGAAVCLIGAGPMQRAALSAEAEIAAAVAEDVGEANAAELVHSALRLEAEGDAVYRDIVLGVAVNSYPKFAPAEWHTGHVWTGDKWQTLAAAESAAAADENLAEYARRRNPILNSRNAEDHLHLARWCRKAGLIRQARYEFAQVFRGSPTAEQSKEAVKWLASAALRDPPIPGAQEIPEGVERRAAEVVEMAAAWTKWTPVLKQIAEGMQSPDEDKRKGVSFSRTSRGG